MNEPSIFNLIVILGPTASGKTALAAKLAFDLETEVISADSRQVYRGMDIGTGKDLNEYFIAGRQIPYHLIDILEPVEEFSLFDFRRRFYKAFEEIRAQEKIPILVGGTGLYLDAVLRGYAMQEVPVNESLRREYDGKTLKEITGRLKTVRTDLHNTTDLTDGERAVRALEIALFEKETLLFREDLPIIIPLVFGMRWEREALREKITTRLKARLDNGLIEEVERLHKEGLSWERLDYFGLEYRHVGRYLRGEVSRNDMFQKLNAAIHQFAKRQETWFRRMERNGVKIHWIENADYNQLKQVVDNELAA